jgi:hypothetical protein
VLLKTMVFANREREWKLCLLWLANVEL